MSFSRSMQWYQSHADPIWPRTAPLKVAIQARTMDNRGFEDDNNKSRKEEFNRQKSLRGGREDQLNERRPSYDLSKRRL